jgi:hypothetical protein
MRLHAALPVAVLAAVISLTVVEGKVYGRPTLCQRACKGPCHSSSALGNRNVLTRVTQLMNRSSCVCITDCETRTLRSFKKTVSLEHRAAIAQRQATHPARAACSKSGLALPTLFVLGVQKCGTTALMYNLNEAVPSLLMPTIPPGNPNNDPEYFAKELHFFDIDRRFEQGASLLGSYFPTCDSVRSQGKIPMDGTPDYFISKGGYDTGNGIQAQPWERAHEFFRTEVGTDGAKGLTFVVVVRDPSSRYISAFNHFCIRWHDKWEEPYVLPACLCCLCLTASDAFDETHTYTLSVTHSRARARAHTHTHTNTNTYGRVPTCCHVMLNSTPTMCNAINLFPLPPLFADRTGTCLHTSHAAQHT